MFENNKTNGKSTPQNAAHPLTAHRWEDGHEFVVYLEPDARGIFREVAAVPVKEVESPPFYPVAMASTAQSVPAHV